MCIIFTSLLSLYIFSEFEENVKIDPATEIWSEDCPKSNNQFDSDAQGRWYIDAGSGEEPKPVPRYNDKKRGSWWQKPESNGLRSTLWSLAPNNATLHCVINGTRAETYHFPASSPKIDSKCS